MLLTIVSFIVILGILVLVHEIGHFVTGRWFGVKVEEFGLGFPPKIYSYVHFSRRRIERFKAATLRVLYFWKTTKNFEEMGVEKEVSSTVVVTEEVSGDREVETVLTPTIYSLNWIPLGGFVKLKGENGDDSQDTDSFAAKKIWQRSIILIAGVGMNLLLAIFLLSINAGVGLPQVIEDGLPTSAKVTEERNLILNILPESPAAASGLIAGDEIISIDANKFTTVPEIQNYISGHVGQALNFELLRAKESLTIAVTPQKIESANLVGVGVGIARVGVVSYPWYLAPVEGVKQTYSLVVQIFDALGGMIIDLVRGNGASIDVSGPVGIAVMTGRVVESGWIYILQFVALLSLNLAIINILPFPALDGGRVLFLIIEKIRGKAVSATIENTVHMVGMAMLFLLIAIVTYRDIVAWIL